MREAKHGRTSKHDILDDAGPEDSSSVWMLSYIDVMTLLVALFALLLAVAAANSDSNSPSETLADAALAQEVSPAAVVVALGIANGGTITAPDNAPRVQAQGALMLAGAIQAWQQTALEGMTASSRSQSERQAITREPLALAAHLPAPVSRLIRLVPWHFARRLVEAQGSLLCPR